MSVGRPTDYDPKFCELVKEHCERGATDAELAEIIGVHVSTIHRWKGQHPEFCDSIKAGKEVADERVERSLYHKAVGYTFDSEKVFQHQGEVIRAETKEHVPPDTTAAIFWLKNRRPDKWRDKTQQEVTGADGAPLVPIINISGRPEPSSAS